MQLLIATRNKHKAEEITPQLVEGLAGFPEPVEIVTLQDFPAAPGVVEDGRTLQENACKKAVECALGLGVWTLADDTGLEVDALEGAPGVLSARYAGEGCDFAANTAKLLAELEGVPESRRGAVFRCVVALCSPQGQVRTVEGRLAGRISERPAGCGGFGYDPVFFLPDRGKTLAELSLFEKNQISHRARAIEKAVPVFRSWVS